MAYKSSKQSKKFVILSLVLVVALAGGGAALWRHMQSTASSKKTSVRPVNTVDYSPAKPSDNAANNERKNSPSSASQTLDNGSSASTPATFSVTITRANADSSAKQVVVGTLVNGTNAGTCTLTLSQSGQSNVTATDSVALQNNSYVCPNFVIPFSQLPTGGQWKVSVTVTNNSAKATGSWPQAITVNK